MKGCARRRYGVIKCEENLPKPVITSEHDVIVRTICTTINRTDSAIAYGKPYFMKIVYGLPNPRVAELGTDLAGIVSQIGAGVTKFKVGDRVFGFHTDGCKAQCEYVKMKEKQLALIPSEDISFQQAAASCEGFHYALNITTKVKIRKEHRVLINGATGAIGSALVQICRMKQCHVTAVCGSAHLDLVARLGANECIAYDVEDFTKRKSKLFDFVFDAVGKSSYGKCKAIMNSRGVYISTELGWYCENVVYSLVSFFQLFGRRVKFPVPVNEARTLAALEKCLAEKSFAPLLDEHSFTLDSVAEGYEFVRQGNKLGNCVLNVAQ